jgi:hypothetical protein
MSKVDRAGEFDGWLTAPSGRRRAHESSSPITQKGAGIGDALRRKSLLPTS